MSATSKHRRAARLRSSSVTCITSRATLERHYLVEALGDLRDDGPVATAFDEPGAVQTTQRVCDRELLLLFLCAEGVAEVLLTERALPVAIAYQQRFEDCFVPVALAL